MFGILKKALFLILLAKTFPNFAFDILSVGKIYPSPQVCFTILREKKDFFVLRQSHFFFSKKWNLLFQYSPLLTFLYSSKFFGGQLSKDNWTNELKSKDWVKALWNGLIVCFLSILKFFYKCFCVSKKHNAEISEFLKKVSGGSLSKLNWQYHLFLFLSYPKR